MWQAECVCRHGIASGDMRQQHAHVGEEADGGARWWHRREAGLTGGGGRRAGCFGREERVGGGMGEGWCLCRSLVMLGLAWVLVEA